jgi:hypothetical protein
MTSNNINNTTTNNNNLSSSSPTITTLLSTCYQVIHFSNNNNDTINNGDDGEIPPETILIKQLSVLRPEHVFGLQKLAQLQVGEIGYYCIGETNKFTCGVFFLAPAAVIPLHNHPTMTVWSQIIYGEVHITAYDPIDDNPTHVRLVDDATYHAPYTRRLLPKTGGQYHSLYTRVESKGCIIVDVTVPPYNDDDRKGQFYVATRIKDELFGLKETIFPNYNVKDLL